MKRFLLVVTLLVACQVLNAQLSPVYDSIPMRDGKKLAMTLYKPSSCTQCPTILVQTPYNRLLYNLGGLPLNVGFNINSFRYNMVIMDWRGFYGSAGSAYSGSPTRGEDGYDAVEWIASQTWSDGQVGLHGPSALGKVQYQTAQENPPHLVCMVPLVAGPQFNYHEYYPGGVLRTEYLEQLDALGYGLSPVVISNPYYNLVWQFAETSNFYPTAIQVPTFMIGGWYDHNTDLMLDFFTAIQTSSPVAVRDQHRLLMGPWVHGGSGFATVGSATQGQLSYANAFDWNDSLALAFFDYYLLDSVNGWNTTPTIQYYQMGENTWNASSSWPPAGVPVHTLYMHTDGSMDAVYPTNSSGSLSFSYNPQNPSPTVGGCTLRNDLEQGPYDQVPDVESRNDILVFTTDTLTADVVLKGKVKVHLKVSSDRKDTDFAIRLTDVYPDGRSMLLVDGITRMRFRNGYTTADTASMQSGTVYDAVIDLPTTCISFLAGHRIRIDVSSSNYPKYNRNDNSGGVMYPALNGDSLANPLIANNTVYLNSIYPSYIEIPVESFIDAVENETTDYTLPIYPNPASGFVTVQLPSTQQWWQGAELFDVSGKLIRQYGAQWFAQDKLVLPLQGIQSGMYIVKLYTGTYHYSARIIVNNE